MIDCCGWLDNVDAAVNGHDRLPSEGQDRMLWVTHDKTATGGHNRLFWTIMQSR